MQKSIKRLLPLFAIIGAFLVIGTALISSGVLPEEHARNFRLLTTVSIPSDTRIIQQPTLDENVFVYAVNDVAERGINIARSDARVEQILDEAARRQAAVTIAAVQPTVMTDGKSGKLLYSPAGQVIITSNWQTIEDRFYSEPQSFAQIANKNIVSHQQIWYIFVDVDSGQVTRVAQQANRVISDTTSPNLVRSDVNMFVPNAIVVDAGSTVRWPNPSNLPHNVVGTFNQIVEDAATADNTGSIPHNSANNINAVNEAQSFSSTIAIDSGFIQPGESWQYRFDVAGVFNYLCTIHAEEGMRGTLIIISAPPS